MNFMLRRGCWPHCTLQIDFNLAGMAWLKLRRVVFREAKAVQGVGNSSQQQAAAAPPPAPPAAAARWLPRFPGKQHCVAGGTSSCWDPWHADSAANVCYKQQQPDASSGGGGSSLPPSGQRLATGQQGTAVGGATAGSALSSQDITGSECVWDAASIPRDWTWAAFADAVGCPARCVSALASLT